MMIAKEQLGDLVETDTMRLYSVPGVVRTEPIQTLDISCPAA